MPIASVAITNATVVLPDEVLAHGCVVVRDGVIDAVYDRDALPRDAADMVLNADGAYLLPGLIDVHNDALEFEVNPRPSADLPLPFALANLERRLAAAGVTTEFHAIAFMDRPKDRRSVSVAVDRARYIASLQAEVRAIEHHVLHRIDVWHPDALESVFESIAAFELGYASLNDHTPGQGQYRNLDKLLEYNRSVRASHSITEAELRARMAERAADTETVPWVYGQVGAARRRQPFVLATHDDDSIEKVEAQHALGATVAEFPITIEAAERARELDMAIVVGAPNILRGASSSGNLPATEFIERDLADVICADYHAPSLLPAAFRLVQHRLVNLPTAVRMLTLNAARAVGLADRGAIQPGMRADLVVARVDASGLPHVEATLREGRSTFLYGRLAGARVGSVVAV